MTVQLPHIESDRLLLRLLATGEESRAIQYYSANKDHLAPSGPVWPDNFLSESFWKAQIERNIKEFEHDISARMFLVERDGSSIVGHISFGGIMRSAAQFCYLGYGLSADKQGLGYMTEILPRAIGFAFNDLQLHRIMANYMPRNERSGNLLKRLGFTIEGYARDYLCLNGKWEDHILSSITNTDWQGNIHQALRRPFIR